MAIRAVVALGFLALIVMLLFLDWNIVVENGLKDYALFQSFYAATTAQIAGQAWTENLFWYLALGLVLLIALVYLYVNLTQSLGLNLLEYIEKTDFKDKIGTLSQFEDEMEQLHKAVPDTMKVIVFIDDLDCCKGAVLGEIIEALQLAAVSKSCIFVLGMDLTIVANVIKSERGELAHSVDVAATAMEHGSGYKFLEKIIQARLSLPTVAESAIEHFIEQSMRQDADDDETMVQDEDPATDGMAVAGFRPADEKVAAGQPLRAMRKILGRLPAEKTPKDSDELVSTAKYYGSRHFRNPRRLKRFINGLRLQSYLTAATRPDLYDLDRLARFLVLAEKWPGLIDYILTRRASFKLSDTRAIGGRSSDPQIAAVQKLDDMSKIEHERLSELLAGRHGDDHLTYEQIRELADWYGFSYYAGLNSPTNAPAP
ncbi:MAG: hypothetical protein GY791_19745 [Alphaproteobacteria bacterium]|nr:hypothetical protein [Alphaproteobacteria bacterium]